MDVELPSAGPICVSFGRVAVETKSRSRCVSSSLKLAVPARKSGIGEGPRITELRAASRRRFLGFGFAWQTLACAYRGPRCLCFLPFSRHVWRRALEALRAACRWLAFPDWAAHGSLQQSVGMLSYDLREASLHGVIVAFRARPRTFALGPIPGKGRPTVRWQPLTSMQRPQAAADRSFRDGFRRRQDNEH